ncbi:phosphate transporter family protein [Ulvibacter sp. MAR_2010_11]|uniref:inorganic phosphate transporter n=1 Tax=Ulvibacter sp. MAR_2010_11 TaxID=1250229 RepID=UPI000C2BA9F4|nr:inorganic phosphate transporter [Ulvibacter sp. MAR_2010_11]PKA83149.1 phosphate transporter family protein [Ulvibacter sp. MAR_2010_11]
MDNIYILMLVALAALAIADLVVGVSNDAVNFLNSAIGSKAISFRTIMIVASLGIAFGALSSSGMMEVARKGIFTPGEFYFNEIMIIFMAVMITDILLLDFFNTLGMPTSTTVSIVFELLGAAIVMSLIKISKSDTEGVSDLLTYINTDKATEIILGILLSVVIAFTVGALVQYVSRLLLTFKFESKPSWVAALFGGIAATSITYFIFIKGLKGTAIIPEDITEFIFNNTMIIVALSFVFWTGLSALFTSVFKVNVYKFIILIGTFAIAMAFAGNDLVNFIGVPIAAWQSYEAWVVSGVPADQFSMVAMSQKVPTPTLLLFLAGLVMVLTLWFSKKAKDVLKTSIDLSSQDNVKERFQPNFLSRGIVRFAKFTSTAFSTVLPTSAKNRIEKNFEKKVVKLEKGKDAPAFDMVRAAVNLMVASILISVATSMKLPLSTTYVTFMVAMGTSLADRAWGSESAVYRVAGVLKVIGGWFFTAFIALVAAGTLAYLIYIGKGPMIAVLLLLAILLLVRNYLSHKKKGKEQVSYKGLKKAESKTVRGIIAESADNISNVVTRTKKIYSDVLRGLEKEDLGKLKKSKKGVNKLDAEVEDLRDNIFFFIKNLEDTSVRGSTFYISILAHLTDITQSLEFISKKSYKHIHNNHKKLRFNQIKDLQEIDAMLGSLLTEIEDIFKSRDFDRISFVLNKKQEIIDILSEKIEEQVERTRTEESSPKNTTLYFSLLSESKDLVNALMDLMQEYFNSYKKK